jgi:hypothetical protein
VSQNKDAAIQSALAAFAAPCNPLNNPSRPAFHFHPPILKGSGMSPADTTPAPEDSPLLPRRTVLKTLSAAGIAMAAAACADVATPSPGLTPVSAQPLGRRRRYAIIGLGSRYGMFRRAINSTYKEHAELVALSDKNTGRLNLAIQESAREGVTVPGFAHTDFDRMIRETKPDTVIVTTVDGTHHQYIVRALELGCDAITEKPMTTTAEKCQQILDAKRRTGKSVRVTFNYRYSPPRTQIKDILMSGRNRRHSFRRFPLAAQHAPRCRLFPPLARQQNQFRRPHDPQGLPPFRPRQLVALGSAGAGVRHRQA